jgi:signal transduction histidine kinase
MSSGDTYQMWAQHAAKVCLSIVAFVLLDWATFTAGLAPLGITPWNPSIGLAVAAVIAGGLSFAPVLALGPLISDLLVRDLPLAWWVLVTEAALTGVGYSVGLAFLLRPNRAFDRSLHQLRDLLLLGAATTASALLVAVAYTAVLVGFGYLAMLQLVESIVRYFVGDMIGLMVMTPFLLLMAFRREFPHVTVEVLLQGLLILGAVFVVVGIGGKPQLQLSFLLLLPIMWLAVRFGFEGATPGLLLMQVCIMVALHINNGDAEDVTMFQALMVMLAITGLSVGQLVSERSRDERRLRLQQDAIARAARVGSVGELTTALAHELNQPLTAAGNFARSTVSLLKAHEPRLDDARYAAEKTIEQVERSAQVIRRLRALIQTGRIDVVPHSVTKLLSETFDLIRPEMQKRKVQIDVVVQPGLPDVAIDLIQIEHVITNLLQNSIEALVEAQVRRPHIHVSARLLTNEFVEIEVRDNGPGFLPEFDIESVGLGVSTKPHGLGVGLSLSRSIVKAHGGEFGIERRGAGATVRFSMPVSKKVSRDV